MNELTFQDLVKMGESDTVEFKTSFDREAIETLVAFANTKGGTIVIGVQNSGKPIGVQLGIKPYNPGNLAHGLTIDQLIRGDYSPSIRNKQIATVFKEAGIIEKYGSGIKRVLEAFDKYALPQPVFEEIQNGFKVTIFKTTQKTTQKTQTREQIFVLLRKNPNMTRKDLARTLSKSPNTIKEHIAKLKSEGRFNSGPEPKAA